MSDDTPKLAPGTLVRVSESALDPWTSGSPRVNRNLVAEHGYIYIVLGWNKDDEIYYCKSLATGKGHGPDATKGDVFLLWYGFELEVADG